MNIYEKEPDTPRITRLVTFRISKKGGGNAIGIGLNDYVTRELFDSVDHQMTDINCTVAVSPEKGRCPMIRDSSLDALKGALATVGPYEPNTIDMAWIANTKDLEYIAVSPHLYERAKESCDIALIAEPRSLPVLPDGNFKHFEDYVRELTN
jgi:hypothetical protein